MNTQNTHKWPLVLAELVGVFDAALQASNDPNHEINAERMALALAKYMGGRQVYIPKASDMEAALRSENIYREFNGTNITQLSQKYSLCEPRIYQIIQAQRALAKQRNQLKLL